MPSLPSSPLPPYEALFVLIRAQDKRLLKTLAGAQREVLEVVSRQDSPYNRWERRASTVKRDCFMSRVELWRLDHEGWHLLFAALPGEHKTTMPWHPQHDPQAPSYYRQVQEEWAREGKPWLKPCEASPSNV